MLVVSPMRNTAPAPTDENIPRANSPHTVQVTLTWPAENAAAAPRWRLTVIACYCCAYGDNISLPTMMHYAGRMRMAQPVGLVRGIDSDNLSASTHFSVYLH